MVTVLTHKLPSLNKSTVIVIKSKVYSPVISCQGGYAAPAVPRVSRQIHGVDLAGVGEPVKRDLAQPHVAKIEHPQVG